ncbi:MAG TPA: glycosyltransferase [Trichormus sp.]
MKSVDIVIAAKNEERFLGRCLDSLAAQNYPQELIRVIVVDNGSCDNTANIAKGKGALLVQKQGGTMGGLRNLGIRHGTGELIGFMDAHCIAGPDWVKTMVERFESPRAGFCQGTLTNICPHPLTQELSRGFVLIDDQTLWEYGVSGLRTPYPWATGGNCMYRRSAIEKLHGHDQSLFAAEDSDMSWRCILAGYSLEYAPSARLTHYDLNTPRTYLRKMFVYGRADALVAHKFGWLGKRERPTSSGSKRLFPHFQLLNLFSRLGYEYEHWRIKLGMIPAPKRYEPEAIATELRATVQVDERRRLTIGPHVVYWFPTPDQAIVVKVRSKERFVLEGTAATIFHHLVHLGDRNAVLDAVIAEYDIAEDDAVVHVDSLIDSLANEEVFVEEKMAVNADRRSQSRPVAIAR